MIRAMAMVLAALAAAVVAVLLVVGRGAPPVMAGDEGGAKSATLTCDAALPGLVPGTLRDAQLSTLPAGIIAKCGARAYKQKELDAAISALPEKTRKSVGDAKILILEQMITKDLLLAEAKRRGLAADPATAKHDKAAGVDSDALTIQSLLKQIASSVTVTDDELKVAYEENKDQLGGATFEAVKESTLRPYVLGQKQQEVVERYVGEIGKGKGIVLSKTWAVAQYAKLTNNPVDQARKSGKPAMVDFGSTGCTPCQIMAPILEQAKADYAGKADVILILVGEHPTLTQRYGVSTIPLQVFFDAQGKEVWRHIGVLERDKIDAKFKELGVTL